MIPITVFAQEETAERYIYKSGELVIISDAERTEGIHYKVEVARLPYIDPDDPELERLKKYGELFTETIDNKDLKSLLIGRFEDRKKAQEIRDELRESGFSAAQVLTYEHGLRQE